MCIYREGRHLGFPRLVFSWLRISEGWQSKGDDRAIEILSLDSKMWKEGEEKDAGKDNVEKQRS